MATDYPIIGRILGHYRVQEQIGAGGMGMVFRAYDQRLERDVALKVLPPRTLSDEAARARLRTEALTLSKLNHAHIAQVYDFDTQDGVDFLVMEFVQGATLDRKLAQGALPEEDILRLGVQISATLEEVSSLGIVHRDLKPSNIMITPTGDVKLLDFGLSSLPNEEATRSAEHSRDLRGTLPYMSPEQLKGQPIDFRSDIYQVGAILYEAATARRPFSADVPGTLIQEILRKSPVAPRQLNPNLGPGVEAVILRCLAKDPGRRYQRASELRAALEAVSSSSETTVLVHPVRAWTVPLRFWLMALVMTLLVVGAGVIWRQRRSPAKPVSRMNELVILPLSPSVDSDVAAFGNGLVHTLTSRLSQLTATHAFQVVPASEVRNKGVSTLEQATQQFGATLGLEIDVERSGDMARVNYALVDATQHRQLDGDTITAPWSDPFALEDRVAESVLRALQVGLRPEEQKLLAQHGTNQPAAYDYYLQGWGYLQDFLKPENIESAIAEFKRALQTDPNYALAYAGLGEAYWRKYEHTKQGEWVKRAKTACDQAVRLGPDQAAAHLCLGMVDAGTGAYEKALEDYKVAAGLEPTNDAAYNGWAGAYEQLGQFEQAENTYRKAISLRPNYWATYNSLGSFYMSRGRYTEASEMYSQVIALAPDSFAGYSNLGGSYFAIGDYEKAIPAFEHSVEIRPTADATSNLGMSYYQVRNYTQAAQIFEKATALDMENYEVWGNLGDAYYWSPQERGKAKAAYQKAIELALKLVTVNPRDASVLGYLAQYYAMTGERTPALANIHQALGIAPADPDLLETAATVFNQCGDTEQAFTYLEKAIAAGYSKSLLRDTPNFDNLRDLPRFKKLVEPKA
jgi:serine/threonine protein kinase/tetratricopeptide (TPR) repeat protein